MDQVEHTNPETQLLSDEQKEILDELLSRLGERCKNVLKLWLNGYSMKEIASKLELTSDTMARKIKYKCKNDLMNMLDGKDFDF